ncbi:MAP kinase-activating death domain protein-like isoform X2 [Pieris rapae]|nr:MAP kinase-activating death domain protein-like isoform X2 [Pieris rapae]
MKLVIFSILVVIHYSGARQSRSQNQRSVLSLQNIISAGNKERAVQMMQLKKPEVQAGISSPKLVPNRPCQQGIIEMAPNLVQNMVPNFIQNMAPKLVQNVAPKVQNMSPNLIQNLQPNFPCQREPEVIRVPVPYPVPVQEQCSSFPSPFLPAASPVSAWSPCNGLLPPVIPSQTRNHFLRKIPIPPPTL